MYLPIIRRARGRDLDAIGSTIFRVRRERRLRFFRESDRSYRRRLREKLE